MGAEILVGPRQRQLAQEKLPCPAHSEAGTGFCGTLLERRRTRCSPLDIAFSPNGLIGLSVSTALKQAGDDHGNS